jgi:hypothetical protein
VGFVTIRPRLCAQAETYRDGAPRQIRAASPIRRFATWTSQPAWLMKHSCRYRSATTVQGASGFARVKTPALASFRIAALTFSMNTPCQQPSWAVASPRASQTSSEDWSS